MDLSSTDTSSIVHPDDRYLQLQQELAEERAHRAALSDILDIIRRSPGDANPVFEAIARSSVELCGAVCCIVGHYDGEKIHIAAEHNNCDRSLEALYRMYPMPPSPSQVSGRVILSNAPVHVEDVADDPTYAGAVSSAGGWRSIFGVPMRHEGRAIGVVTVMRAAPGTFPPRQIGLLKSFADQAVIAIENARLFEAEQARARELQEALESQKALSEVLELVAKSPGEASRVLEMIARTACRLCEAERAIIWRRSEVGTFFAAAHAGVPQERVPILEAHRNPGGNYSPVGLAVQERRTVHVPNVLTDPRFEAVHEFNRQANARTLLCIPLLTAGEPLGGITLVRTEEEPFSPAQIALVEAFADQAVIAIENARLFEAEQTRTKELASRSQELEETIRYKDALSHVFAVIVRSSEDLNPVYDAIVHSAARLCKASVSTFLLFDGRQLSVGAVHHEDEDVKALLKSGYPCAPDRTKVAGRVVLAGKSIHIEDLQKDPDHPPGRAQISGTRALLAVPLLSEGRAIGVIAVGRPQAELFSDRQIQLIETFADQAVIAIENARLLDELQTRQRKLEESLKYQRAISNLLVVISRSAFKLQPVLDTIASTTTSLCQANATTIWLERDGELHYVAGYGDLRAQDPIMRRAPIDRASTAGRAIVDRLPVHIHDLQAVGDDMALTRTVAGRTGIRTTLGIPLLREGKAIGALLLRRTEVRPFAVEQIALVETFADQAVIAIENARLLEELQTRQRELAESLQYQTAISEVLAVISRSPTEVQPVFDTIAESSARLCGGSFSQVNRLDGDMIRLAALHNLDDTEVADAVRSTWPRVLRPGGGNAETAMLSRKVSYLRDLAKEDYPHAKAALGAGVRSLLTVPILRGDDALGAISVFAKQPSAFSERQIDLLESFADQAAIAINNVGLFEQVQIRSQELAQSVEELRSLGEVGQAVSSSLDISKVLQTVLENACRMAQAGGGTVYVYDKATDEFRLEAGYNMSDEHIARVRAQPMRMGDPVVGECAEKREAVQIEDLGQVGLETPLLGILLRAGVRAILALPLLHQGEVIGALAIRRSYSGPFSPETVRLLQAFAAQSAIAVNNARLFREVEETSEQLRVASQHKSQFLANMSHELRTPLNAILGYTELMQDRIYGDLPDKASGVLDRVQSNGKHLLGLINQVLDLSKIEAGQFKLNLAEYSMSSIIETVVAATESLATEKKLALRAEVARELPRGIGDEQRIVQVLLNLVGNAIKFTDRGEVRILAGAFAGRFEIAVIDTGPGIAPEEIGRIFEEFHQVDNSNTKVQGGTGLGLAIAKRIVEMHGGRVSVESTVGRGSRFKVELPVQVEQQVSAEAAQ